MSLSTAHSSCETLTVQTTPVENKRVLIRVDFNVPMNDSQKITDDTRIRASLPTIRHVRERGGKVILMSHLGRPKGKVLEKFSLKPVAQRLSELLEAPVSFAPDCIGSEVGALVSSLKSGDVLLLENLRFHEAEEHPDRDPSFAQKLSQWGDVYVNDAFGTAHRSHSSTAVIAKYFPQKSAAGLLIQSEIQHLGGLLHSPQRPFLAMIGGAKISSKINELKAMIPLVDKIIIGGAMAFTFLKALGYEVGASLVEDDYLKVAKEIISDCRDREVPLILPLDAIIAKEIADDSLVDCVTIEKGIPSDQMGLDIGPQSIELFTQQIHTSQTIFWNGPLGVFEVNSFAKGTFAIAKALASHPGTTVVGGGDSVAAVHAAHLETSMTHVSTGGGASLEFLQHGTLPGIEALSSKKDLQSKR